MIDFKAESSVITAVVHKVTDDNLLASATPFIMAKCLSTHSEYDWITMTGCDVTWREPVLQPDHFDERR
uniref:Uncharacterized protein n=1 Tax=Magallana gigas TaxID=29159 RepID=K1QCV9_MAGGI